MGKGALVAIEVLVRIVDAGEARASCAAATMAKGVAADEVEGMPLAEMVCLVADPGQLPAGLEIVDSNATELP